MTRDVDRTPLLRYLSLDESAQKWAQTAMKMSDEYLAANRQDMMRYCDMMKESGFDVTAQVRDLEKTYKELLTEYGRDK